MRKIKIAFVGLGRVFVHYLNLILSDQGLCAKYQIIGLVDTDESLFGQFSQITQTFPVHFFTTCEALVHKDLPDIVVVSTPSGSHYELTKFFLSRRIAVLCEKPAAMKLSEAKHLLKIAEFNRTKYWVAFQNRYNPSVVYARDFISRGMLGRFLTGSLVVRWSRDAKYYSSAEWRGTYKNDGGVINNQAIHHIDALTYLLNSFSHVVTYKNNAFHKDLEVEDTMIGAIRHEPTGNLLTLEMTTAIQNRDHEATISLFGESGFIQLGGVALNKLINIECYNIKLDLNNICDNHSVDVADGYGFGHRDLLYSIYNDFIHDQESISRATHSFHTAQIINASYLSCESKWASVYSSNDNIFLGQ